MNRLLLLVYVVFAAVFMTGLASCEPAGADENGSVADSVKEPDNYSDLPFFELSGKVKECSRTTYYRVNVLADGEVEIDSAGGSKTVVMMFDKRNHYVKKAGERVKRDSLGRIVRWEDRTTNAKGVHGGFLVDTLAFDYNNPYVLISKGMGELTTTTRDKSGNIIGQVSTPLGVGPTTSAQNVVLSTDEQGNWVKRLIVWTDNAAGQAPRVCYMLDTREIKYY